jgi:hypothetical protein
VQSRQTGAPRQHLLNPGRDGFYPWLHRWREETCFIDAMVPWSTIDDKACISSCKPGVEKGVPVQPNEKTRICERASAGEQTFTTTTARSKNASTVGTAAVSFEQL